MRIRSLVYCFTLKCCKLCENLEISYKFMDYIYQYAQFDVFYAVVNRDLRVGRDKREYRVTSKTTKITLNLN